MARPRSFDTDAALDGAMRLFWRNGYAGTSFEDITSELGVGKPSLYAAFGNKRELFERALERYAAATRAKLDVALGERTAIEVAATYLRGWLHAAPDAPPSCLMVKGAMDCSPGSADVQQAIATRLVDSEKLLAARLARAIKDGDLRGDRKAPDLARFLTTTAYGLAVQAAAGVTIQQLHRVVDLAVSVFAR